MYALVRLLAGFRKPLLYKIPSHWPANELPGSVIHVPLKNKSVPALVIKTLTKIPSDITFEIKQAESQERIPHDESYRSFIEKIADFYHLEPIHFYQRLKSFLASHPFKHDEHELQSIPDNPYKVENHVSLTDEQSVVVRFLDPYIHRPHFKPTLLHGITGSGKTEVYKTLIKSCIKAGKSALFLLPEVSLSVQFEHLFAKSFGDSFPLYSFHSATKAKEKNELWQRLMNGQPCLIVGVHLPVFLPIPQLGIIIVDEEHETGFQEKKHPRINSKHAALLRAQIAHIPVLLGSATPCLNSLHQVEKKNWDFFALTKRFTGHLPVIHHVSLIKSHQQKRKYFWISSELEQAIKERLANKEQTIIYLNRRGFSFFVQCKSCGFTFTCPRCSVSLTLHKEASDAPSLRCHYCDHREPPPSQCRQCHAQEKELLKKGIGTQQLSSALQDLFPQAVVARADLDTAKQKKEWHTIVESFSVGTIDILVGTQLITKGYHFPNVTLVGVIWADLNLHFPVFDASLITLQKLIQVAGRAGRGKKLGEVIIQSFEKHEIFDYLNEEKYLAFCQKEKGARKEAGYPPFVRLATLELKNTKVEELERDALNLAHMLSQIIDKKKLSIVLLGPSLPLVQRVKNVESRHITLKSTSFKGMHQLLDAINHEEYQSSIYFVPLL